MATRASTPSFEANVSPNAKQGYHYFHNAETFYEVGEALGRAMAELHSRK